MTKKAIFFDLDGTITDSGEGIMNCATLALEYFGLPVPSREEMRVFVGPPLDQTFIRFGVPADKTDEAIKVFRSRYTTVGKFENFPYPGVADMLQSLKGQGHRLFVATSKPEVMAIEVLRHFDLDGYFEQIAGATLDGSRSHKADVITYLLGLTGDVGQTLMVGDTAFDVIGAAAHGISTIGVSWGYGTVEDMEKAGAVAIAHSMEELVALINQ
ncbi:MAG: HAD hydrolase-like protein [Oscillospiraceae bacterium]|nr:HAD hydrolase-like protein [Oscillospiraceae bacterium]